jgi:hypothetical protein
MAMGRCRSFVLTCVLIAASALPAESEFVSVQLETGNLLLDFPFGGLVAGAPGLSIFAGASEIDASHYPLDQCAPCKPGDVVSLSGGWFGTSGGVSWQGTFYSTGGALDPLNDFRVSTPALVMPPLGDPFTAVLPFDLSFDFAPRPLVLHAFGEGFVTAHFVLSEANPGTWFAAEADYRIAITPEPATWLLVASGILVPAGLRRWRKRSL